MFKKLFDCSVRHYPISALLGYLCSLLVLNPFMAFLGIDSIEIHWRLF